VWRPVVLRPEGGGVHERGTQLVVA